MVKDMLMMGMFWALIIGPCLLASKTGLHRDEEYEEKSIMA